MIKKKGGNRQLKLNNPKKFKKRKGGGGSKGEKPQPRATARWATRKKGGMRKTVGLTPGPAGSKRESCEKNRSDHMRNSRGLRGPGVKR